VQGIFLWSFIKKKLIFHFWLFKGGVLLKRLVKNITENFASEEQAKEVEEFFKTHEFPGTERTVQQSIETIRLNAVWLQRDMSAINIFLKT
jgi:puromycin-sensitive aminopeptidase